MKYLKIIALLFTIVVISCKSTTSYPNLDDGLYADIQTVKGDILIQLEYEHTPITVANFVSLAEGTNPYVSEKFKGKPFYDGLKFHRVVEGFVIQGGDPNGNGTGGPGYKFEDEFPVSDSATILLSHDRAGILSMANSGPGGTNGSQFFITLAERKDLDGRHTVFGHVVKGQEVVDSIAKDDVMNTIKIIQVGDEAKDFNAAKVFGEYFKKLEEEARIRDEKLQNLKDEFLKLKNDYESNADRLSSGLRIHFLKKGNGIQPSLGTKVKVYYAGYFTTGDLFATNYRQLAQDYNKYDKRADSMGGYDPVDMDYSPDAQLIPGFKEGLQQMSVGDIAMLFIPSHLAYGPQGYGPIPPDTDLIFQLEIVSLSE